MNGLRPWWALALILGLSGCSGLDRRPTYGPTTRTVPSDGSRQAREAVDPFAPRTGKQAPADRLARYFPGLIRPHTSDNDLEQTDSFARRVPAEGLAPPAAEADLPSRAPRGLRTRRAPTSIDSVESIPVLPVGLTLVVHPNEDDGNDPAPAGDPATPFADPWRSAAPQMARDGATRRARAEAASPNGSAMPSLEPSEPAPEFEPASTAPLEEPGTVQPDVANMSKPMSSLPSVSVNTNSDPVLAGRPRMVAPAPDPDRSPLDLPPVEFPKAYYGPTSPPKRPGAASGGPSRTRRHGWRLRLLDRLRGHERELVGDDEAVPPQPGAAAAWVPGSRSRS
jgi:hypothetical protein